MSSSHPEYEEESFKAVDHLLRCNGYANPRDMKDQKMKSREKQASDEKTVCLKLPYVSERVSENIRTFIRKRNLPIKVIFTPGKKLRELFCSSRPHDGPRCTFTNCLICPKIVDDKHCAIACPLYKIVCNLCQDTYVGESSRTLHDRMSEHLRYASNPGTKSYLAEALAVHYREKHPNTEPSLNFELLGTERNTVLRKIKEAMLIHELKPDINDKSECTILLRFLVKGDVILSD